MVWHSFGFTHDTYLMVCQPIGFTHRRIRRASPLVSGRPVSPTHSTRTVSPSIMHVHVRGIEMTHISRLDGMSFDRAAGMPKKIEEAIHIIHFGCMAAIPVHTRHISGGMSANRIHSPSNTSCLAPCLWSPGLAHSLTLYSLSVHYACTCERDRDDTYRPI